MGGIDGFIGDGNLRQTAEEVLDVFYSANLLKAICLSADYQVLFNPGYNADRAGPVQIPGVRIHAEF
jgi:carbohydrate-selective porin OprB